MAGNKQSGTKVVTRYPCKVLLEKLPDGVPSTEKLSVGKCDIDFTNFAIAKSEILKF